MSGKAAQIACGHIEIIISSFPVKPLFAAELVVEARRAKLHCPDQVVEGGTFVATIPEKLHRLLDGSRSVKRFGAPSSTLQRLHLFRLRHSASIKYLPSDQER